jgi:hypothetical protein
MCIIVTGYSVVMVGIWCCYRWKYVPIYTLCSLKIEKNNPNIYYIIMSKRQQRQDEVDNRWHAFLPVDLGHPLQ